jgi:hypothetical protein
MTIYDKMLSAAALLCAVAWVWLILGAPGWLW